MRDQPKYFLYGETPVKFEATPDGGLRVLAFDRQTGTFLADSTYWSLVMYDRDNLAHPVDEAEFHRQVTSLHSGSVSEKRSNVRKQPPTAG